MTIDDLAALATVLLAMSLASERLVTIVKTLFPTWLAEEKTVDTQEVDPLQDKWRRFAVQMIAFVAAWITSAFLAKGDLFDLFGYVEFGKKSLPVFVLGMLSSGGSAFWNYVLGYSKALKDAQKQASESLVNLQMAEAIPADGGVISPIRRLSLKAPQMRRTLERIAQLQQPPYNLSNSRLSQ